MASYTLYPPIVDSSVDAFVAGSTSSCRVYFSLSKFNASEDFESVHVSVKRQGRGTSVIKTEVSGFFTSLGIVLNMKATKEDDNLYYIDIPNALLEGAAGGYTGWIPGWIYEIQLRLSAVDYDGSITEASWVNEHGNDFSEWSTVCRAKAIGEPNIEIPPLKYSGNNNMILATTVPNLNFYGTYKNTADSSEYLSLYRVRLYEQSSGKLLEDSGTISTDANINVNSFNYIFHVEPIKNMNYHIVFTYQTNNRYTKVLDLLCLAAWTDGDTIPFVILNAENKNNVYKTTAAQEADYGFIGLKVYDADDISRDLTYIIRRASSRDNFTTWTDIKKITLNNEKVSTRDVICDFTIESGIWYKYGIQSYDETTDTRGPLVVTQNPSIRNCEYTYLLGSKNKQLRIEFNNTLSGFKINTNDSVQTAVDGKYPFTSRKGKSYYKTFTMNGLISFAMDDFFATREDVYKYDNVISLYSTYNNQNSIEQYDFTYEREFRDKVMEFIYDGKAKLYKSPTEGNMIIKLSQISLTPVDSTNRLIYSFSANATEIAEINEDNLLKYNLVNLKSEIGDDIKLIAKDNHTYHGL